MDFGADVGWAKDQPWACAGSEVMTVGNSVVSHPAGRGSKPLFGIRRRPGRLALAVFRLPVSVYRRGWGGLLGHTFLVVDHAGRKTGLPHSTVAMVLSHDLRTNEAVICSAWGPDTDWIRNIRARPALQVHLGRDSFTPQQRFLSEDESLAVLAEFRHRHPGRSRLITSILGWGDLRSDSAARDFVRSHPFVSFRPAESSGRRVDDGHASEGHVIRSGAPRVLVTGIERT